MKMQKQVWRFTILALFLVSWLSAIGISGLSQNKPYTGVTVVVATGSYLATNVQAVKDQWESQTGGRIEIVSIPFGDLYPKLLSSFVSGTCPYDVIIYPTNWISEFVKAGWIINLDPFWDKKSDWDDVLPIFQEMQTFEGHHYAIPLDGDVIILYYRKDALENPEYQARFREKYGYDLPVPPKTWEEYRDVAEFFNGWDWDNDGKIDYGCLEAQGPHSGAPYILAVRATSYISDPAYVWFDPDTMEPQINNPGWVQALKDWIEIKNFGPPTMVNYGLGEVRGNYIAGLSALAIDWGDIGIMAQDPAKSNVKGKLGFALAPGTTKVWDPKIGEWELMEEVHQAPYLGWSGWCASVTSACQHPEAAFSLADFLDTRENALKAVTTPGARNPYRYSHFDPDKWATAPVHFVDAKGYLDAIYAGYTHPNAVKDLRIPGAGQYVEALDRWIAKAIAGTMSPQEALDKAAEEWQQITERWGLESQRRFYRDEYGLPPLE